MKPSFRAAVVCAALISLSCKTTRPQTSLKHTLGDVSWGEGRWTYLDLDRATFLRMNDSTYLPESHSLTFKAEEWVNRLHAAAMNKYPDKMSGIPHPKIIVMKKSSPDAFAARRRIVSYKLKTSFALTGHADGDPLETQPLYLASDNKLAHNIFPPEIHLNVDDPESYSAWFSKRHAPCSIEHSDYQGIPWSYGPQCKRESYLKPTHWSPEFVTYAAPNWLIITSGLFQALPNEESFAAVLAHELAHYYRAHVVNDAAKYNYCYMLNDPLHKPVERDELQNLCRDLKAGRARGGLEPAEAAARAGLGVYTIEQEADELALELLTLVDIEPIKATDAWFALFEQGMGSSSTMEIPLDRCRQLFRNNWKDANGQPVAIPIGDYSDPHHSWCFRAFNTTNEISNHGYRVSEPLRFDAQNWQNLRQLGQTP